MKYGSFEICFYTQMMSNDSKYLYTIYMVLNIILFVQNIVYNVHIHVFLYLNK